MFLSNLFDIPSQLAIFSGIGINDYIDILLIAYLTYCVAKFFKDTRSIQVLKGIVVLIIALQLAELFRLNTIKFILENAMQVGVFAIIVLFQPELRNGLSKMGRSKIPFLSFEEAKNNDLWFDVIKSITNASRQLSEKKVGALIVIERNAKIMDIIRTGIMLNANVSSELLINIFYPKAPLHDGAVIISEGKIKSAGCFLPLSQNDTLDSELGTRHRAGLGISESTDCVVVIVSEETGKISLACDGGFNRNLTPQVLEEALKNLLLKPEKTTTKSKWKMKLRSTVKKDKK